MIMAVFLKQKSEQAVNRSVLIGTVILMYMILFGHSFPPGKINPNLF